MIIWRTLIAQHRSTNSGQAVISPRAAEYWNETCQLRFEFWSAPDRSQVTRPPEAHACRAEIVTSFSMK